MASFSIPASVVLEEIGGGAVALNLDSGQYYELDAVGTAMLARIREHGDLAAAADALVGEFDAPADRISRDLDAFAALLESYGIVRRTA